MKEKFFYFESSFFIHENPILGNNTLYIEVDLGKCKFFRDQRDGSFLCAISGTKKRFANDLMKVAERATETKIAFSCVEGAPRGIAVCGVPRVITVDDTTAIVCEPGLLENAKKISIAFFS